MSGLAVRGNALPSLEKARAILAGADSFTAIRRLEAVADVIASENRGNELGSDAAAIVCACVRRRAELDAAARAGRLHHGAAKGAVTREVTALPSAQKVAESKRAPVLALPVRDEDAYYRACKAKREQPTKAGLIALARQTAPERKTTLATMADAPSVRTALSHASKRVVRERLEDVSAIEAKAIEGVFDAIVIDPPWPMEKIERDVRPNQGRSLDYPTMGEAELCAMTLPAAKDCHLWCWTTSTFLPLAFRCLEAWGFSYSCLFVWHKPGGPQPAGGPQFNCEPILYARRGSPKFVDTKAFFTCFEATRGKHSEKPEAFYDVVRRVTAGRRLDMFNRRAIPGFEVWGKEADRG